MVANLYHIGPRPDRPWISFGIEAESLIPSSLENLLSIFVVTRTVNRHRWMG
jgi:hypothetical protein